MEVLIAQNLVVEGETFCQLTISVLQSRVLLGKVKGQDEIFGFGECQKLMQMRCRVGVCVDVRMITLTFQLWISTSRFPLPPGL